MFLSLEHFCFCHCFVFRASGFEFFDRKNKVFGQALNSVRESKDPFMDGHWLWEYHDKDANSSFFLLLVSCALLLPHYFRPIFISRSGKNSGPALHGQTSSFCRLCFAGNTVFEGFSEFNVKEQQWANNGGKHPFDWNLRGKR